MKKTILALALALTMAAPAASSFANTVTGSETSPIDSNVKVEGVIKSSTGQIPAGKIEVELPTKMPFSVDQKGAFTAGSTFTVTNKSAVGVDISVTGFSETIPSGGITLVDGNTDLTTLARTTLSLNLSGNKGGTFLVPGNTTALKISEIAAGATDTLSLVGKVGKKADTAVEEAGVAEDFNVVFRIQKTP